MCKDCGGGSICVHGNVKSYCKVCRELGSAVLGMDDPFFLQDHGAAADPFHDFQGLQGLQREEEEEEEEMAVAVARPATAVAAVAAARSASAVAAAARPAAAALELDPRFVERGGFIEEYYPFADFSPEDPEDPREFSGGKHKRRYTKRRQNNTRTKKNKRNKKMTKRKKTNKKKYKYV
jgi:hypothetical protein